MRQLSLGQRMRGDLAAALLHDPELLYLDEPTIGLDVVAKARIREFLLKINAEQGVTVLLTVHTDTRTVFDTCPAYSATPRECLALQSVLCAER